ncbi:isoamylase early set domain-containing protein [Thermoactinospora rubra]|uniref:isoamylase early set domain-containing protein n=1 Tax=Thermoactinospora rubra TaxID=1088767 RepID=UPI001982459E|nr:isoamylase early set domain-containing protein [Thermoactinospora rubra]
MFTLNGEVTGPVSVVGDFNGWDPYAHPMKRQEDGRYSVSVSVPEGETFAFRYLGEGGRWFDDPHAAEFDERGAIVRVPLSKRRKPVAATTTRRTAVRESQPA